MAGERLGAPAEEQEQKLVLVWLNIERTKLAYQERAMLRDLEVRADLRGKLQVERAHLLSPLELGKKATRFGLHTAKSGQIRRMGKAKEAPARQEGLAGARN